MIILIKICELIVEEKLFMSQYQFKIIFIPVWCTLSLIPIFPPLQWIAWYSTALSYFFFFFRLTCDSLPTSTIQLLKTEKKLL